MQGTSLEKDSPQVLETHQPLHERPISAESVIDKPAMEKPDQRVNAGVEDGQEPIPHLHMKTYLTVFAICLIYFAQLINVVGAGAVSLNPSFFSDFG